LITRREGIRRGVEENTILKTLKPIMFHASALIDLAIEHGEDVTRSISSRNVFLEGMAWSNNGGMEEIA